MRRSGQGSAAKERRGLVVVGQVEGLGRGDGFAEDGFDDLGAGEGDHRAEAALEHQVAGGQAQPGGQHAVVGAGGAAALEVAEDDAAGLEAGLGLDGVRDGIADAAEPGMAERVGLVVEGERSPGRGSGPLPTRSRSRSSCLEPGAA